LDTKDLYIWDIADLGFSHFYFSCKNYQELAQARITKVVGLFTTNPAKLSLHFYFFLQFSMKFTSFCNLQVLFRLPTCSQALEKICPFAMWSSGAAAGAGCGIPARAGGGVGQGRAWGGLGVARDWFLEPVGAGRWMAAGLPGVAGRRAPRPRLRRALGRNSNTGGGVGSRRG
jgi:hypothetical protein